MKVMYVDVRISFGDTRKIQSLFNEHTRTGRVRSISLVHDGLDTVANITLGFANLTHPVLGLWVARRLVKKVSLPLGGTTAEYRVYYENF